MRVLITEGRFKHALGILRVLGKAGHEVCVLNIKDRLNYTKFSKYCAKNIVVSSYDDEKIFVDELLQILEREKFNLVIPVGFPVVGWLCKNSTEIKKFTNLVLPEYDTLRLFEDKEQTQQLARACGVPVPETWYPKNINEAEGIADTINYPAVIKGVYEAGGNIVDYGYSKNDLLDKYKKIVSKNNFENRKLPMIQEYLTGKAKGFFALYHHGVCVQHFMHERIREYPRSGGASSCAKSIYDEQIFQFGKKILDAAKYHGVAMVEFKYNENGVPYLLEVNPKFWGSFDLSVSAGVDFPNKLAKISSGEYFVEMEDYKKGIFFSWFFEADWQWGIETGQFWKFFFQLFRKNVRSNVTMDDIKPSLVILYFFFWKFRKFAYSKLFK